MTSQSPLILLTNDDGVQAAGLRALYAGLEGLAQRVVVAPTHEQSASSHAITIDRPLRHIEHEPGVHSVDGTPADCVYLALFERRFLPRRPDLVLSGINHGTNLGTSVFYSGTVAGAREAAMRGIPAMALSQDSVEEFGWSVALARQMVERYLAAEQPPGKPTLLNVNFPRRPTDIVRVTRVGEQIYEENVIPRRDPGGREYFWIGGKVTEVGDSDETDGSAIAAGHVSVTPLQLEATRPDHMGMAAWVAGPGVEGEDG